MRIKSLFLTVLIVFSHAVFAQEAREQGVLFTNVMVWDGTSEALRKADVLVTGNTIAEISDEPLAVIGMRGQVPER